MLAQAEELPKPRQLTLDELAFKKILGSERSSEQKALGIKR